MRMIAAKPEGNGGKKPPLLLALGSRSSHGSLSSLHSSPRSGREPKASRKELVNHSLVLLLLPFVPRIPRSLFHFVSLTRRDTRKNDE